jgi:hypothetical protein
MATCESDHSGTLPGDFQKVVKESQAKRWRHVCAGCAYELGLANGAKMEARLRGRVRELMDEVDKLKAQLAARK